MKNINFLTTVITAFLLMLVAGCTKDPVIGSQNNRNDLTKGSPVLSDPMKAFGMISGYVLPMDAKAEIHLSNDVYTLGIFYPARDGSIMIANVPAGYYKLFVHPHNPAFKDESRELFVLNGETTFIKIQLQSQ